MKLHHKNYPSKVKNKYTTLDLKQRRRILMQISIPDTLINKRKKLI